MTDGQTEERAVMRTDMSHGEYAKEEGLNATAIKAGRVSMLHMHNCIVGPPKEDTPAMLFGRLIHLAALEPDAMMKNMVVFNGRRAGEKWSEFTASNPDREIVTPEQRDEIENTILAINRNQTARRLIDNTIHEASIFWTDRMLGKCKARVDGIGQTVGLLEVKITGRIDARSFGRQFFDMGYDLQCGWYVDGAGRCAMYDPSMQVWLIVVDSSADHDVYVMPVPAHIVKAGLEKARQIGMRYRACQSAGMFPGVANGDDILNLEVPAWIAGEAVTVPTETMEAGEIA